MRRTVRTLRSLPLRWHLVLVVAGALFPVVIFAGYLVVRMADAEEEAVKRGLASQVGLMARDIDREMAATIRTLEALAQSERFDRNDMAGFYNEAQRVVRSQPSWLVLIVLDDAGRPLLNTSEPWGEPLPTAAEPASVEQIRTTRRPTVGPIALGRRGRHWAFPIRVPVVRNDSLRFILTAAISSQALGAIVSQGRPGEEWTRSIIDPRGIVAARAREPGRWVGHPATPSFVALIRSRRNGVERQQTLDGKEVYSAFAETSRPGWTAVIAAPVDVVEGFSGPSPVAIAILGGVLLSVSTLGALLLARRIARNISAASASAAALADGTHPAPQPSSVTEIAQLFDSLGRSAALLERRDRERAELLAHAETARREAEAASRSKDEFLAMLGHELRNPLSPIVFALELIDADGHGGTEELAIIQRQVKHLERMLDDLLDISRITRGKFELRHECVAMSGVIASAVEMVRPLIQQHEQRIDLVVAADGLTVEGDAVRLAQVVANLLTNASRYSDRGGHIVLSAERRDEEIVLTVSDAGRGIDPELLPNIFEPFVQGPRGIDRRDGGLGIGLTLVRSIVELHLGTIEARSGGAGHGSTFIVRLPRAGDPAGPTDPPVASDDTSDLEPMRVLVVDDNVDAALLLAHLFRRHGHEVIVAHDGLEALDALDAGAPDLAVLDIGLPTIDGNELAVRIRERFGDVAPVLVAVTGYGQRHDRARSREAGFAEHFVKPVDPTRLLATVASLLGERRRVD